MSYIDPTRLRYVGAWSSSGTYSANDVVLYNSRLYVCNAAVLATPIVGSFSSNTTNIANSTAHISLPAGCAVGDIVVGIAESWTSFTLSGVTVLVTANITSTSFYSATYMYTVTAGDLSNGYFNLTVTSGAYYASTVGYVVRGVTVDTTHVATSGSTNTPTSPSVTPSGAGYLFQFLGQYGNTTPTQGSLNGVTTANAASGYAVCAVGYEAYTSGPTVPRTWTSVSSSEMTYVVPVLTSQAFQTSSFSELSDDNSLHYKGAWFSSASYSTGDLVTYNKAVLVANRQITAGPLIVGASKYNNSASIGIAFSLPLPAGSAAGDLLVFVAGARTSVTPPTGFTTVPGVVSPGLNSTQATVAYKIATAQDVVAQGVTVPTQGLGSVGAGIVLYAIRNLDTLDFAQSLASSSTSSGVTPTHYPSYVLYGLAYAMSNVALAPAGLTSVQSAFNGGASGDVICGFSPLLTTGSAPAMTWGTSGNNYGSSSFTVGFYSSVVPTGAPDAASWDQIVDNGNLLPTSTQAATISLVPSSFPYQRLDGTTGEVDVTPPQTTTPGLCWTFKRIDSSSNVVQLIGTFDGATNYALSSQYNHVTIVTTGTAGVFEIIG